MGQRVTWAEMKRAYPDEWLRLVDFELDETGEIKCGEVLFHSRSKEEVYSQPLSGKSEAFWYTGESTFSGLRSHATHDHI
ncbi:MAG: hypothetical protein V2A66_06650 [Pseudomonadota bacterium]